MGNSAIYKLVVKPVTLVNISTIRRNKKGAMRMTTIPLTEWRKIARRNGIPDTVYEARVQNKWEHERAASEKLNDRYASKHFTPVERATMKENGIPLQTAIRRLKSGKYTRVQVISEKIVRRMKDE